MKQEQQVASYELAQQLKALGISQRGFLFYWQTGVDTGTVYLERDTTGPNKKIWDDTYAAPTVAELGIMLPQTIQFRKTQRASIKISRFNDFTLYYNRHSSGSNVYIASSYNEAEARAKMLIQILEDGIVTPDEINNRLISC